MEEKLDESFSDYVPSTRRAYHYRAVATIDKSGREWVCSECGSREYLQVHHLDNNFRNNALSNLCILCAPCHSRIHEDRIIPKRGRRGVKK